MMNRMLDIESEKNAKTKFDVILLNLIELCSGAKVCSTSVLFSTRRISVKLVDLVKEFSNE